MGRPRRWPHASRLSFVRTAGDFHAVIKHTDRLGGAGGYLGETGETLAFQAYSRLYAR